MPDAILNETIAAVTDILGPELERIAVERAVIGLFFTGVKLSAGTAGCCATPREAVPGDICCPVSAKAAGFEPVAGRLVAAVITEARSANGLRRALGIATLNALAELCWARRPHPDIALRPGLDAFEAAAPRPGELVVLVGAFVPFLKELKRRGQPYLVLEANPAALKPEEMPFYRPAEDAPAVVPTADLLLITGSALLGGTLEELLALARPQTRVAVVGPSVGLLPDPLLGRGVDIIGASRITRPDAFLDLIAEGGSAPHFLGRSVEKVTLVRRPGMLRGAAA